MDFVNSKVLCNSKSKDGLNPAADMGLSTQKQPVRVREGKGVFQSNFAYILAQASSAFIFHPF